MSSQIGGENQYALRNQETSRESPNSDWYKKAKQSLLSQKEVIYEASDRQVPDRYRRYHEVMTEIEKLERWKHTCAISSS